MGNYLNPGNQAFMYNSRDELYVDKTGLIRYTNKVINTSGKCIALSHARRFGKSQAAGMLNAYYSKGCDSRPIFEPFEIAKTSDWDKYLNQFNVIRLDMATLVNTYKFEVLDAIKKRLFEEILEENPDLAGQIDSSYGIPEIFGHITNCTGSQFVIIIDEWDCVIRNYAAHQDFVHQYMQFLHDLFKSEESREFLALGYITGILPIKKIKDESTLNNFREFSMVNSRQIARYYGFTEEEVEALCERYSMDLNRVKAWYDGYLINGLHMYNPNSVVQAMMDGECDSYWKNTASFESILTYITLNFDGLKDDVLTMLAGGRVDVNTNSFQNDLSIIRNKNDALTALIHLGYLAYDSEMGEAFIPNYEVATAYEAALIDSDWTEVARSIENVMEIINDQ